MISWLTVKTNPPRLGAEIIVKNSNQLVFNDGIYCELMHFPENKWTEQEMIDELSYRKFDLWSDVA